MRGTRFAAGLLLLFVIGVPTHFLLEASKRSKERSDTRSLLVALQSLVSEYSVEYGDCPLPKDGGLTYIGMTTCDGQGRILDAWDRPLVYRVEGAGPDRRFILYSLGPDGRDESGRGDDVTSGVPQVKVGRAPPAAPPPSLEIVIPPETGPLAFRESDLEFDSKTWEAAILEVSRLVPTELTPERYMPVFMTPARTTADLLYKAAYVRFSVPRRSTDGGPSAVLLAICKSGQHSIVRQSAMAALRGIHLKVPKSGYFHPDYHPSITDPCPGAVLDDQAPEFAQLARHYLKMRASYELTWMIQCLLVNEEGFPKNVDAMAPEFAEFFVANQEDREARNLARLLVWDSESQGSALVAAFLERFTEFSPAYLVWLMEPHWSQVPRFLPPLLEKLYERLKAQADPEYGAVKATVKRLLKP